MYLSYFGIRVQDPRRSQEFYQALFDLEVVDGMDWSRWSPKEVACVLLRDPRSGQRLELNYYPPGSPYATAYEPGDALDRIAFRVDDLPETLARLEKLGYLPEPMAHYAGSYSEGPILRMAYVRDPDGIQLELFQSVRGEPVAYSAAQY